MTREDELSGDIAQLEADLKAMRGSERSSTALVAGTKLLTSLRAELHELRAAAGTPDPTEGRTDAELLEDVCEWARTCSEPMAAALLVALAERPGGLPRRELAGCPG